MTWKGHKSAFRVPVGSSTILIMYHSVSDFLLIKIGYVVTGAEHARRGVAAERNEIRAMT